MLFSSPLPQTPISPSTHLSQSNTLNLNVHALWQLVNSHTAPRWLMGEVLLVDTVHFRKAVHGCQKHIDLDHLLNSRAGFLEHGSEVLDAELCHVCDGRGGLGEDLAGRCAWDLAGAVDCRRGGDSLGVRSCCCWGVSFGNFYGMRRGRKGIVRTECSVLGENGLEVCHLDQLNL